MPHDPIHPQDPSDPLPHDHAHDHGHEHEHLEHAGYFHKRAHPKPDRNYEQRAFTVGVGGAVGSGKTALVLALCEQLRDRLHLAVVTNDIFRQEDAEFLIRHEAPPTQRTRTVETGGCPHAAIREDIAGNLLVAEELTRDSQRELLFLEFNQGVAVREIANHVVMAWQGK